jgi:hemerythrin superfamily protein
MDAIGFLKHEHREVDAMFRRFASLGAGAKKTKQELAHKIVRELAMHTAIEEQLLYPRIRVEVPGGAAMVKEALQEHQDAKELLVRIDRKSPGDEGFEKEMRQLIKDVRHHVKEEEGEIFPKMRKAMSTEELQRLGEGMKAAKVIAPTHPHPHLPSRPPANIVTGLAAAVADRLRDLGRDLGRQVVNR